MTLKPLLLIELFRFKPTANDKEWDWQDMRMYKYEEN